MTRDEFAAAWEEYSDKYGLIAWTAEGINDFCNIYATSYEEYMAMWEELTDMVSRA